MVDYQIKTGDTLSKIAKEYGVTVKQLQDANGIKNANLIFAGKTLKIPDINLHDIDHDDAFYLPGWTLEHKDASDSATLEELREQLAGTGQNQIPQASGLYEVKDGKICLRTQPTSEELAAKEQLDTKVSSTDISYADANKTIEDIRAKYNDDKYFTEVTEERKLPENIGIYYPQLKTKKFDPSKLPEPDRTTYNEAVAAKKEIENNNKALVEKAGAAISHVTDSDAAGTEISGVMSGKLPTSGLSGLGKPFESTEKQKAAINKLNEKTSSTGIKYKDAKAKMAEITEKYKDNPDCKSEFESEQPNDTLQYIKPYTAFDPYKLPEPDRTAYFEAMEAAIEIEEQNSALVSQAGTGRTERPSQNYHGQNTTVLY